MVEHLSSKQGMRFESDISLINLVRFSALDLGYVCKTYDACSIQALTSRMKNYFKTNMSTIKKIHFLTTPVRMLFQRLKSMRTRRLQARYVDNVTKRKYDPTSIDCRYMML